MANPPSTALQGSVLSLVAGPTQRPSSLHRKAEPPVGLNWTAALAGRLSSSPRRRDRTSPENLSGPSKGQGQMIRDRPRGSPSNRDPTTAPQPGNQRGNDTERQAGPAATAWEGRRLGLAATWQLAHKTLPSRPYRSISPSQGTLPPEKRQRLHHPHAR